VFQAVLDHVKLQCTHRSNHLSIVEGKGKQLSYPFVHQLVDAFVELFGLHGVGIVNVAEMFGREARDAFKVDLLPRSEGIPNFKVPRVV